MVESSVSVSHLYCQQNGCVDGYHNQMRWALPLPNRVRSHHMKKSTFCCALGEQGFGRRTFVSSQNGEDVMFLRVHLCKVSSLARVHHTGGDLGSESFLPNVEATVKYQTFEPTRDPEEVVCSVEALKFDVFN